MFGREKNGMIEKSERGGGGGGGEEEGKDIFFLVPALSPAFSSHPIFQTIETRLHSRGNDCCAGNPDRGGGRLIGL